MQIKLLDSAEWPLLKSMRIRAVTEHPNLFYDSAEKAEDYEQSHWQNLLTGEGNQFFALYDNDRVIGITGIVTWEGDLSGQTGMIGFSFIEPDYRGQGLSNLLYQARLNHAAHYRP